MYKVDDIKYTKMPHTKHLSMHLINIVPFLGIANSISEYLIRMKNVNTKEYTRFSQLTILSSLIVSGLEVLMLQEISQGNINALNDLILVTYLSKAVSFEINNETYSNYLKKESESPFPLKYFVKEIGHRLKKKR